jgi:hypothetical protein
MLKVEIQGGGEIDNAFHEFDLPLIAERSLISLPMQCSSWPFGNYVNVA